MEVLTAKQLIEWEAYDTLDPIGKWRDDYQTAALSSLIINALNAIYSKKGSKPKMTNPIDFMPDWSGETNKKEPVKQSIEEMKSAMLSIANVFNKNKRKQIPKKK